MFDLTGKVALVTGGNGGIGLGFAEGLAEHGAGVCIWGTNEEKNAAAKEKLLTYGGQVEALRCDVSDEDQVVADVREDGRGVRPRGLLLRQCGRRRGRCAVRRHDAGRVASRVQGQHGRRDVHLPRGGQAHEGGRPGWLARRHEQRHGPVRRCGQRALLGHQGGRHRADPVARGGPRRATASAPTPSSPAGSKRR